MTHEQAKTLTAQLDAACKAATRRMTRSTSAEVGKRWCEGCQAYHRLSAFDEAFTGRRAKGGRTRLKMRCRAWHKAHPRDGETTACGSVCVLCGAAVTGNDAKTEHYESCHPERAGRTRENLAHGWRAERRGA